MTARGWIGDLQLMASLASPSPSSFPTPLEGGDGGGVASGTKFAVTPGSNQHSLLNRNEIGTIPPTPANQFLRIEPPKPRFHTPKQRRPARSRTRAIVRAAGVRAAVVHKPSARRLHPRCNRPLSRHRLQACHPPRQPRPDPRHPAHLPPLGNQQPHHPRRPRPRLRPRRRAPSARQHRSGKPPADAARRGARAASSDTRTSPTTAQPTAPRRAHGAVLPS